MQHDRGRTETINVIGSRAGIYTADKRFFREYKIRHVREITIDAAKNHEKIKPFEPVNTQTPMTKKKTSSKKDKPSDVVETSEQTEPTNVIDLGATDPNADADVPTKRPVQTEIPGTEGFRCKEIEDAADDFQAKRDKRMQWTTKEVASKDALVVLLHAHAGEIGQDGNGAINYRYGDILVTLAPTEEKLKVKAAPLEPETGVSPKDTTEGDD